MREPAAEDKRDAPAVPDDPPTTDRLRKDIDLGATGEKVAFPDPAAAPLGTDDEAAGTPPTRRQREMEREARPMEDDPRGSTGRAISFYVGAAFVAGILLLTMAYLLE